MVNVVIFGGTGFTGNHIAAEAVSRGHSVTSLSRNAPHSPLESVIYRTGTVADPTVRASAIAEADVVVIAVSPRGETATTLESSIAELAQEIAPTSTRLGIVGGAGSLFVSPDGPQLITTPNFPAEIIPEATTMGNILTQLRSPATPSELNWFYLSPPAMYGAHAPGVATGKYQTGTDILLTDGDGNSAISGEDFALAFVDEIENSHHSRTRFTVAN